MNTKQEGSIVNTNFDARPADADRKMLQELEAELQAELAKPHKERSYDRVDELTAAICDLRGETAMIDAKTQAGIAYLQSKREAQTKRIRIRKWVALLGSCAALVIGLNVASVAAFDRNILSAVIEWQKGSFTVQMSEPETEIQPAADEDPYGMIAKCEEYGFTPLTPTYMPEGFELERISEHAGSKYSRAVFYYKKDNFLKKDALLNFQFWHFNKEDDVSPIGIPSDGTQPEEEVINGITMITLKEDNQFKATFLYENTIYLISGYDLDYDECYKVAASFATSV